MPNQNEIRIQNVSDYVHDSLLNIAKNNGVSIQEFLKPKLRELADSYPEHLKKPPRKD